MPYFFQNFSATILQHGSEKINKISTESLAKYAVVRPGPEGKFYISLFLKINIKGGKISKYYYGYHHTPGQALS